MRRKLASRGFDADVIEQVLDQLAGQGLQSDERYAENYVEERMRKGFGPLRIRAELRERGIDGSIIESYLALDDDIWMDLLARTCEKKFGQGRPASRAETAKRARFLEYRGFSSGLVGRFLRFDD